MLQKLNKTLKQKENFWITLGYTWANALHFCSTKCPGTSLMTLGM